MSIYKIIIAGSSNPHIPSYLRYGRGGNTKIIAVSEANPLRMEENKKILCNDKDIQFYTDYRAMFDDHADADIVMIGSDNIEHFEMFKEALKYHFHIYMMKVVSMDEEQCLEMIRLQKHYNRMIACELELRFIPQFRKARELIKAGAIGEIRSVYLTNVSQSPCNYFPNWGDPLLSYGKLIPIHPGDGTFRGGAITDHPHPYDVIRWITGAEFRTVSGMSAPNQRAHLQVEDHAAVTGLLNNGITFFVNPSYSNLEEKVPVRRLLWPKSLECNLKVTGTKGYISCDYFDSHCYILGNHYASPDRLIVDGAPQLSAQSDETLLGNFIAALEGRRVGPETSLNESYQAVRVMNAVYDSIYSGKSVELK